MRRIHVVQLTLQKYGNNLSYDYGVFSAFSQRHLVMLSNRAFFKKKEKKKKLLRFGEAFLAKFVFVQAFPRGSRDFRCKPGLRNLFKWAKQRGWPGAIFYLKLQAVLRIHRNYPVKWTCDCTEKTSRRHQTP